MTLRWSALSEPQRHALRRAVRGAVVVPSVFAFAVGVIGDPQVSLFAAFGSFALLLMVDFGGPLRARLLAYLGLGIGSAVLIVIGTLCSRSPLLAAGSMAVVGFVVLFSGVINGYFAVAATGAVLTYVLPVSIPADPSMLPDRLAGWGLACLVGIPAALWFLPDRSSSELPTAAGRACLAIAGLVEAGSPLRPGGGDVGGLAAADTDAADADSAEAVRRLQDLFVSTPYRPTGISSQDRALACLVHELGWVLALAEGAEVAPRAGRRLLCADENRQLRAEVVAVLRASGDRLFGRSVRPRLGRLERARTMMAEAIVTALAAEREDDEDDEDALMVAIEPSLRLRALSYAARSVALSAIQATGSHDRAGRLTGPGDAAREVAAHEVRDHAYAESWDRPAASPGLPGRQPSWWASTTAFVAGYASPRSVWFRNSVRGAVGLALAVLVAHLTNLQHSFWIVLATLSVLRSTTMGIGSTVLRALVGTVAGVLLGAVVIVAIGPLHGLLWAVLPVAVLLAGYAPGVLSFATGQAAFSLMVLILFNVIAPAGWSVGLVRIEDIAIGCAISLVTGLLVWPRGVGTVLGHTLADAYARGIDYVADSIARLSGTGARTAADRASDVARATASAGERVDDALRHYLAGRSSREDAAAAAALVAGAHRIRLSAYSLAGLAATTAGPDAEAGESEGGGPEAGGPDTRRASFAAVVEPKATAIQAWYHDLSATLFAGAEPPTPEPREPDGRTEALRSLRRLVLAGHPAVSRLGVHLMWANQQLEEIRDLEVQLTGSAAALERDTRRPWRRFRPARGPSSRTP